MLQITYISSIRSTHFEIVSIDAPFLEYSSKIEIYTISLKILMTLTDLNLGIAVKPFLFIHPREG